MQKQWNSTSSKGKYTIEIGNIAPLAINSMKRKKDVYTCAIEIGNIAPLAINSMKRMMGSNFNCERERERGCESFQS